MSAEPQVQRLMKSMARSCTEGFTIVQSHISVRCGSCGDSFSNLSGGDDQCPAVWMLSAFPDVCPGCGVSWQAQWECRNLDGLPGA